MRARLNRVLRAADSTHAVGASNKGLFGRVAVAARFITMEQLDQALREHGRSPDKNLGQVLIELGFLTEDKLERVLELQKRVVAKAEAKAGGVEPPSAAPPADARPETPSVPASAASPRVEAPAVDRPAPAQAKAPPPSGSAAIDKLLRDAAESGASDVHIHSGAPIKLRMRQNLYDHGSDPLTPEEAQALVFGSLSSEERELVEKHGELDFCYVLEGVGRFRANVFRQLRGWDGIFRFIPETPPSLEDLGLPSSLARFTTFHQGMVLLTGPTSCGKSSTMAALVNLINEERSEHILTIEDPIEYLHASKRCIVNQRSVHRHTQSFARALRGALREDPDIIVIGELRDRETIALAMTAAETGHLVLATLHTDNAVRTVNRLIGAFPPDQQEQVRSMLSESVKAVVSQRLLPTADETDLVAAIEILVVNRAVGNLIRDQKTVQIRSALQTGSTHGMCLLDSSLAQLVSSGRIAREQALRVCEDAKLIP